MKIISTKKPTKKQQIFDILNKQGYIYDSQTVKILGEKGLCNIGEYTRIWKRLRHDQDFFGDKKIIEKQKGYRKHLIRIEGQEEGQYYLVGKEFFKTLNI